MCRYGSYWLRLLRCSRRWMKGARINYWKCTALRWYKSRWRWNIATFVEVQYIKRIEYLHYKRRQWNFVVTVSSRLASIPFFFRYIAQRKKETWNNFSTRSVRTGWHGQNMAPTEKTTFFLSLSLLFCSLFPEEKEDELLKLFSTVRLLAAAIGERNLSCIPGWKRKRHRYIYSIEWEKIFHR